MEENIIASEMKANIGEKEISCIGLELSDGSQVYLKSIWETTNFSIVVLERLQAWSRTVSAKEVVSIAKCWNIDVHEFMKSARSHLCRQHPTSSYSISSEMDADIVQLSFTIDDLLEGDEGRETLNFNLRLARLSDVRAVVRDMLDHLLETTDKLKEQLTKAENQFQFQKKLHQFAASEPEPSITLSLARSNVNSRRQCSPFVDFTKFSCSEERDITCSVCTLTPVRARDRHHHLDSPKLSARLSPPSSFDLQDHSAKKMVNSNAEMEREPVPFLKNLSRSRVVDEVRSSDRTVRTRERYFGFDIPLSPHIMRVLNNLSAAGTAMQRDGCHGGQSLHERRDDGDETSGGGGDDQGVKITEVNCSTRGEERPPRSFMVGTNSVSIDLANSTSGRRNLFEEEGGRGTTTVLRQNNTVPEGQPNLNSEIGADFTRPVKGNGGLEEEIAHEKSGTIHWSAVSEKKKLQENHNCKDVNGETREKGSSNARGGPVHKFAAGEAKDGSDEEPTSKVSLEDAHLSGSNSDSGVRIKAEFSEKPRDHWSNEGRRTGEKNDDDKKLADLEPCVPIETRKRSAEKRSLESLWSKDIIGTVTPSSRKSGSKSPGRSSLQYARRKGSGSHLPEVENKGRKRAIEDRDGDFSGKALRSVKLEVEYSDGEGREGIECRGGPEKLRSFKTFTKDEDLVDLDHDVEEIQNGPEYKKSELFQSADARLTIAELIKTNLMAGSKERGRGRGRSRGRGKRLMTLSARSGSPSGTSQRRRLRSDCSPAGEENVLDPVEISVDNVDVPDPDYCNFDKERTEEQILPNEVWAVYDEKDGLPRVWAWINKVSRHPKFEVAVTWLKPHNPSVEAENRLKTSGYLVSCGMFEQGGQHVLTSINMFSHRMEYNQVARNVVTIYPRKDEVWALFPMWMTKPYPSTPDGAAKGRARFRVVHVLQDVEPEKSPFFSVLERVKGFRTVYKPAYQPGAVPFSCLARFSHRVPAYQLQGNESPTAANLKGSWDVDPAGLPRTPYDA